MASAITPIAGTAVTSDRSDWALAVSPVSILIVSRGRMSVEMGFFATRITRGWPVVIPPSTPPARLEERSTPPLLAGPSHPISSWASDPRRRATSKPSPISTPLAAGIDMRAAASRPSSFRSHDTCDPKPTTTPRAITSTIPPSVSPSFFAASISRIMASVACWSRQRVGDRSAASLSGVGSGSGTFALTEPNATTWLPISTSKCDRSFRHTAPHATRAAVSRALARSRMSRASALSYLRTPTRSACPGRGRTSRRRRRASGSVSGSEAITSTQLSQSLFAMCNAIGEPRVSPARTPLMNSTASASIFIRAPRPYPCMRRRRSRLTSSTTSGSPAGIPSRIATSPLP